MDLAGSGSVVPSGSRQSHCQVISRTHCDPFQVNSMVRGIESFLGGGGLSTVAMQLPDEHVELIETVVRCAYSGWLAAMLMPVLALADKVSRYSPFHSGSAAKDAGASQVRPPNDVAATTTNAFLRCLDIFPPERQRCEDADGLLRCRIRGAGCYIISTGRDEESAVRPGPRRFRRAAGRRSHRRRTH